MSCHSPTREHANQYRGPVVDRWLMVKFATLLCGRYTPSAPVRMRARKPAAQLLIKFKLKMASQAALQKDRTQDPKFKKEWAKFEEILYGQLEKILEKRPPLPVTTFADK